MMSIPDAKQIEPETPEVKDSRRLTGPNLVSPGPAAVIDASLGTIPSEELVGAWTRHLGRILPALGWAQSRLWTRVYPDGVSLAFDAPIDALYAATEVNEWAFASAVAQLTDTPRPRLDDAVERLSDEVEQERNPKLIALERAASEYNVCFTWDDDHASVGMGSGSRTWPTDRLPDTSAVPWAEVHDIPVVLVTGSNGKTTTVRMLAAIVRAWGRRPGYSCTDGIVVGTEAVDSGDWSGPGGARAVLRDPRVQVAILETARGGLLRRGLALGRADAALVSNIAADHLGEWGVHELSDIADAKLVVRRAVTSEALVINVDDSVLAESTRSLDQPWQALTLSGSDVPAGGTRWHTQDGVLGRTAEGKFVGIVPAKELPSAMGGGATYNVYNALGASALAHAMGVSDDVIAEGLRAFGLHNEDNPGRGERFDVNGAQVIVDFAHNPHGVRALSAWVKALGAEGRVLTMVGQAGDRDDASIQELARATLEMNPDHVVIKAMPEYARGRPPEEVVVLIADAIGAAGFPPSQLSEAASEMVAVERLLDIAAAGDLVVLPVQVSRSEVLALVRSRATLTS
jgi:cyanophycin synthetase